MDKLLCHTVLDQCWASIEDGGPTIDIGLMFDKRGRGWANIEPVLVQCLIEVSVIKSRYQLDQQRIKWPPRTIYIESY